MALHIGGFQKQLLRVSTVRKLGRTTWVRQSTERGLAEFSNPGSSPQLAAGTENKNAAVAATYKGVDSQALALSIVSGSSYQQAAGGESGKSVLPVSKPNLLPASLFDLESIFLGSVEDLSLVDRLERYRMLDRIVQPVSYTGDDIFPHGLLTSGLHPAGRGVDLSAYGPVTREKHPVTCIVPWSPESGASACAGLQGHPGLVFCSSVQSTGERDADSRRDEKDKGPSPDQLMRVKEFYVQTLPNFFKERHDYRAYHQNMVFENNYFLDNRVYQGVNAYATQLVKVRLQVHLAYAHVSMSVQSATVQPEEGTVRVHWRIEGLPQLQALKVWKYMPWNYRKSLSRDNVWHEGISTFWVGTDGLVHRHRVERVMRDEEPQEVSKAGLTAKLAALFGMAPRSPAVTFGLFMKKSSLARRRLWPRSLVCPSNGSI